MHEDSDRIYEIWSNQERGPMYASSSQKSKRGKKEAKRRESNVQETDWICHT